MKAAYHKVLVLASTQALAEGIGGSLDLCDCKIYCVSSMSFALRAVEIGFYHAVFVDTKLKDARQFLFKARHLTPLTSFVCVTPETVPFPPNTVALNFQLHHSPAGGE
jgi:hypothetical protein